MGDCEIFRLACCEGWLELLALLFRALLRDFIISVFSEMGLGRPWSFKNRPHALHKIWPDSSLRQSGVVLVWQFWQIVGPPVVDTEGDVEMVVAGIADRAGLTAGEDDADGCCVLSLLAGAAAKTAFVGGDAVEAGADVAEEFAAEFPDDSAEVLGSVFTEGETEAVGANVLRGVSS